MKVIFDINNSQLEEYLLHTLEKRFSNIQQVTYQHISQVHFIFKYVRSKDDVIELQKYPTHQHTLIPIIQSSEYMFHLLEYYPLSYIRVHHLQDDIEKCLSLMESVYSEQSTMISFKMNYSYIQLKSSSIYCIESFGHYLMIYSESGEYQVRDKLSRLKKLLEDYSFIQVHRSYLVNTNYIKQIHSQELMMSNTMHIPLGEKYKPSLSKIL